jgi:hypothetical protein
VIAFGCDPIWRTERGITAAGPRAFGYDFDFVPVEELAAAPGQLHSGVHNSYIAAYIIRAMWRMGINRYF